MSLSIFVSFFEHSFTSWSALPIATIMARSKKSKSYRTIIHVRIRSRSRVKPIPNSSNGASTAWRNSDRSSKSLVSDGGWTKTSCHFVRRVSNRSKRQPKVSGPTHDRQREDSSRDVENIDVSSGGLGVVDDHHRAPSSKKKKWVAPKTLTRPHDQMMISSLMVDVHLDASWWRLSSLFALWLWPGQSFLPCCSLDRTSKRQCQVNRMRLVFGELNVMPAE